VGRSVIYCIITKKSLDLEDTRTTKREKPEKWNDFFKRDLTEIISALNSKNEFCTLDTLLETAKILLEFTGGRTTLYRILKSMGFKYKFVNNRNILKFFKFYIILKNSL
jgi:hypothetical protein